MTKTTTKKDRLTKDQWDSLTHEEKRALAQKQLAVDLEISRTISRQQAQDKALAALKWQKDAPMREAFKAHMALRRRLMRG